jgi:phage repressor protein C with HTH and peptisase S24 domain
MKTEFSKLKNTDPTATDISIHICNKLKDYFIENGVKYNDIASVLDVTQAAVSNQLNGRPFGINSAKKWSKAFGFSIDWLTTGEGAMFSHKKPTLILKADAHEIMGPKHHYNDEIPVVPGWMFRAPHLDIYKEVMSDPTIETLPVIPHLAPHELFARCPGDAMAPRIRRGYLMALTRLEHDAPIMNGEIYAVNTGTQGMIVRRIKDNKDGTWTCTPCDTDHFQPFDIDRSDVITVFRIVGVLITNIT